MELTSLPVRGAWIEIENKEELTLTTIGRSL